MATLLKTFQDCAVNNACELLEETYSQLSKVSSKASRDKIVQHNGCLLIEAPTGAGKTLIAGRTAEKFSHNKKIIWFWFAPFSGLIEQSIRTIKKEFHGLTVRDPKTERTIDTVRSGDIFVTTWGSVSANTADSRKTRTTSDEALSLDVLIPALKSMGYQVGVIVDEAHHGFKRAQEALNFYCNVIAPEYTIMVTATPKDRDIDVFKQATGFAEVHRISISRQDCIEAGLIKKGIKAIAFVIDNEARAIADFEKTAIRHGLLKHKEIEADLEASGFNLKPLMLVQVDSKADVDTIAEAKKKLMELGVKESQIAVHTAEEPDPNLLAITHDENISVLIFKVAVALGFDCPRASVLVSMRRSRDADFGVQVVGRILRVHRQLQMKPVSTLLQYGYVILADYSIQEGLTSAADRINSITSQLTSASNNIGLTVIDSEAVVRDAVKGQVSFWDTPPVVPPTTPAQPGTPATPGVPVQSTFFAGETYTKPTTPATSPNTTQTQSEGKIYPIRKDIVFPKVFLKEVCNADMVSNIAKCISAQINLDGEVLTAINRRYASATKRTTEIFDGTVETESANADIDMREITKKAQGILFEDENISGRTLHDLLIQRLKEEFRSKGMEEDRLEDALSLILATYPKTIRDAKRKCYANFIETTNTASIPLELLSEAPLQPAKLNVYGVIPSGLSTDEKEFCTMLDNDTSDTVLWWHRSQERKPYAVSLVMPELKYDFYPDFIVGVKGRSTEDNILLIEIKGEPYLDNPATIVKARASHKKYKKVMMLHWQDKKQWRCVINDNKGEHNLLEQSFRFSMLPTF